MSTVPGTGVLSREERIPSRLANVFLANLNAAIFAAVLLHVLLVSGGAHSLFRDSDSGWHIRTGEDIVRAFRIPRVDPYSFTRAGQEWFAWEWLSDAALGAVHQSAGLPGVTLLAATLIAAAIMASCALALRLRANFFLAGAGAALLMGATSMHWLARPHLFSWLLAIAFLAAAEKRKLTFLPLLAVLWANVHGSFLLGPAILGIYALGSALRKDREQSRSFLLFGGLTFLTTFANPYGWRLHQHVFAYLGNDYLLDHVSEFASFNFHLPGALYVEGFLLVALAGGLAALRQGAYERALLTLAMLHLALFSARHMPLAALTLLPLALGSITAELRGFQSARIAAFLDYSERLRDWDRRVPGILPVAAAVVLAAVLVSFSTTGFDPQVFPVKEVGYFSGRESTTRVFSSDQFGGYLIYRFGGRLRVFFDGRSDFYGTDFLKRYAEVAEVRPGWERVLEEERVNAVLVKPDQALAEALRANGHWLLAQNGTVAWVFERE